MASIAPGQPESAAPGQVPHPTDTTWRVDEWKAVHRRRQVAFGPLPESESPAVTADEHDEALPQESIGETGPETEATELAREAQTAQETKRPSDLVGLALSGGGLRSAFFNDGLLQALSHRGFLRYVDFLSSVSGGGYVAGHRSISDNN